MNFLFSVKVFFIFVGYYMHLYDKRKDLEQFLKHSSFDDILFLFLPVSTLRT